MSDAEPDADWVTIESLDVWPHPWRWLRGELMLWAGNVSYWVRPFDQMADARRWMWERPSPCGRMLPPGVIDRITQAVLAHQERQNELAEIEAKRFVFRPAVIVEDIGSGIYTASDCDSVEAAREALALHWLMQVGWLGVYTQAVRWAATYDVRFSGGPRIYSLTPTTMFGPINSTYVTD